MVGIPPGGLLQQQMPLSSLPMRKLIWASMIITAVVGAPWDGVNGSTANRPKWPATYPLSRGGASQTARIALQQQVRVVVAAACVQMCRMHHIVCTKHNVQRVQGGCMVKMRKYWQPVTDHSACMHQHKPRGNSPMRMTSLRQSSGMQFEHLLIIY